jgi:undecaprenyl diphosphate synthase
MAKQSPSKTPRHVAIIMDGNGRWAKQRGLPRLKGHQAGSESVIAALKVCREEKIEFLTLYAFSVENWVRPRAEIMGLMHLLRSFIKKREAELHENKVRLRVIGRLEDLPVDVRRELVRVMEATRAYEGHQLILALSYGARTELTDAARALARDVQAGRLAPEDVDEQAIASRLYAPDVPDPDLMIRTSGECRLSNFLLWQLSYTELYFTPVLWPDFREDDFREALADYARRKRRFGDIETPC